MRKMRKSNTGPMILSAKVSSTTIAQLALATTFQKSMLRKMFRKTQRSLQGLPQEKEKYLKAFCMRKTWK